MASKHSEEHAGATSRLIVVAFADEWSKPAMAMVSALEAIRMGYEVDGFAQIFIVEATAERDRAWELGIVSTPALAFFWDAQQVLIQRPDWEDDLKLVGALSHETLLEVIRHARESCASSASGEVVVSLDF